MISGIGAFFIVAGFILGVYCGVLLSMARVVKDENGVVKQGKLTAITFACVVAVIMVFLGQVMFFNFEFLQLVKI